MLMTMQCNTYTGENVIGKGRACVASEAEAEIPVLV